jgi:hypothetical protein
MNFNRTLLVDYLNEMKKSLTKKPSDAAAGKSGPDQGAHDSSLLIFKLFSDLELADAERVNKVSLRIATRFVKKKLLSIVDRIIFKLTSLSQRLSNLEKVFGPGNASVNENQIAKLCPDIENKTILVSLAFYMEPHF